MDGVSVCIRGVIRARLSVKGVQFVAIRLMVTAPGGKVVRPLLPGLYRLAAYAAGQAWLGYMLGLAFMHVYSVY